MKNFDKFREIVTRYCIKEKYNISQELLKNSEEDEMFDLKDKLNAFKSSLKIKNMEELKEWIEDIWPWDDEYSEMIVDAIENYYMGLSSLK